MTPQEFRTHQWTPKSTIYYQHKLHSVLSVDFEKETIKIRDDRGRYKAVPRFEASFTLEGAFNKWKDLPEKVKDYIMKQLNAEDVDWINASKARQAAIQRRDFREAQRIKEAMERSLDQVAKQYIKECGDIRVSISEFFSLMTPKQRSEVQYAIDENFFLADMIETNAVAINSILDKIDNGTRFPLFDNLIAAGKEARRIVQELDYCSSERYQQDFANIADNLKEMIRNKVVALKRRTDKRNAS